MDPEDSLVDQTVEDDLKKRQRHKTKANKRRTRRRGRKNTKKKNKGVRAKIRNIVYKKVRLAALTGLPFFVLLFMTIGIISFITSMPGMMQEGILKNLIDGIDEQLLNYTFGSDYYLQEIAKDPNRTQQKKILKYIDDMGFDPVGFGFVASYTRNGDDIEYSPTLLSDEPTMEEYENDTNALTAFINDLLAAKEYNDATVQYTKDNDLLFNYIAANERAYLIHDKDKIGNVVTGVLGYKDYTGMIETKIENAEGIIKDWDDSTITVDREGRQMVISSLNVSLKEFAAVDQVARYDLDSYTSRYGMPLEFLLALHIGTMSPDLTEEIVKNDNLQTVVKLIALKDEYSADYEIRYKGKDFPIQYGKKYADVLAEYELLENIHLDENTGTYKFNDDVDFERLKEVISVSAIHNWIQNIESFSFKRAEDIEFTEDCIFSAKDAFLGGGTYRVLYRMQANRYKDVSKWTTICWLRKCG